MKPVFCGNLEYDTHPSDLEQLFSKFGRVDRVDLKSGYAFIYFEDERDADYAIRNLDNMPFGYERRKLSVEWSRGERGARHREGSRSRNTRPTKTLFIINFDPIRTRPSDIEWHFEPYGKIISVRIRKNFAFVQFETQSEATKALECTNMSKILDQVITVDYALSDDGDRGDDRGGSPRRGYGGRGAGPYGRSMSPPYHRGPRFSPDYARRSSPEYGRRSSAIYGRSRSPVYDPYDGPVRQRGRNAACGRY